MYLALWIISKCCLADEAMVKEEVVIAKKKTVVTKGDIFFSKFKKKEKFAVESMTKDEN